MTEINISAKKRKKERIKINNLNDFKETLKREGYKINEYNEEKFKAEIAEIFEINNSVIERLYEYINDTNITYRVNDAQDFIDYIEKMILFENEHKTLCKTLNEIKKLSIDRIEYERERTPQNIAPDIIKSIEEIKGSIFRIKNEEEKIKLENLKKELDKNFLYSKDIELLKKMILIRMEGVKEKYDSKTKIKTISIEIPKKIDYKYITAKKGTVEYNQYLRNNIPRMQRLIRNINKYMEPLEKEEATFKIDQSKALHDSINIALAVYDNKEFKAISGSNDITNYCIAPLPEEETFKSNKVNKLGKLGLGYNRVNDSEKKILEEIHKQIEAKVIRSEGKLILYSKWEPCPSCCFVISQFCKKYPDIKVQVKYIKKYGE